MNVKEEDLIEYVKPILKAQGFKKKAKRWTKITDHFTYIFFIQGSCYNKENYYVRPGIIINDIEPDPFMYYGHMTIDIPVTTKEDILSRAETYFSQWSSIDYLKKMVSDFVEWDKRNPVEKRRVGEVDYEADPVPAYTLFSLSKNAIEQILKL
ncbi:MAG: DUF4304 domain-containing protein [Oscillospiraceae bacterium]|nr:DUF4304 domain-containing protein [Oscillospiraceae bacterium]